MKVLKLGANPNIIDNIHKQIPLTLAVIQSNINIIKILARKSNILSKDKYNNTPISYSKNNNKTRKSLINPLFDILIQLCIGKFGINENKGIEILNNYFGLKGFNNKNNLNIYDSDGKSPLLYNI